MKKIILLSILLAILSTIDSARAQSTAFTYQGVLSDGGSPANGNYDLEFYLRDALTDGNAVGATNVLPLVPVTNGLFTVSIDFGSNIFTGTNYWLELGVRTNGSASNYSILSPRQALSAVPYALYALTPSGTNGLNGTNGATGPAGPLLPDVALVDTNQTFSGTNLFTGSNAFSGILVATNSSNIIAGTFTGSGAGVTGISGGAIAVGTVTASQVATGQVVKSLDGLTDAVSFAAGTNVTLTTNGQILTIAVPGIGTGTGWNTNGNAGTVGGVSFLGTTDNQPLELRVNNLRGMRYENGGFSSYLTNYGYFTPNGAPNVIGGSPVNFVASGVVGAVIGGGGATNYEGQRFTNSIAADLSVIGGGYQNTIQPNAMGSTITGGYGNTAYSGLTTIDGGLDNTIQTNSTGSTIGGGGGNTIQANAVTSTIGGGIYNIIQSNAYGSTIAGGANNTILPNAFNSTIGGGFSNSIQANASFSMIGGGIGNTSTGSNSTIPGGFYNGATTNAFAAGQYAQANHTGSFVWSDSSLNTPFADSASNQFLIRASGGVGIGTTSPDALLSVNGAADKPGGGSWGTFSDARLKDVGAKFTHGLEALDAIQPIHYHYKSDNPLNLPSQPDYVGVVAQQVQGAIPEAVQENKDGYLTVNNDPIIWTMFNAIKELNRKNETEVKAKDAEIQELKVRLEKLEQLLNAKNRAAK